MATNFLYMFEFYVDDLLITKPNCCAPEEYPTCVEISFRSSVFICICDREFNKCVDICGPKCCKCCLFTLESEITDKDRVKLHVYKKKDEKCKFLEGVADLPVKTLFDKVTFSFDETNPNWMDNLSKFLERIPDPKSPNKDLCTNCFTCDDCDLAARPEQFCPTNATIKRLLPLYNMHGVQTGNIKMIVRLVCNGPTIVSSYAYSKICNPACEKPMQMKGSSCAAHNKPAKCNEGCATYCVQPDPCIKCLPKKPPCKRYFSCNLDQGCPCSDCEDYCDRDCPTGCAALKSKQCDISPGCKKRQTTTCQPNCFATCHKKMPQQRKPNCEVCEFVKGGNNDCYCLDCQNHIEMGSEEQEDDSVCFSPCLIEPSRPNPGPEAYEEYEADFNDCGLVIRVLKDTHKVELIDDGRNCVDMADDCTIDKPPQMNACDSLTELYKTSNFVRRKIQSRTCGNIVNHPTLPKIRANVKYSAHDTCFPENYHINFTNLKNQCGELNNKVDYFRRQKGDMNCQPNIPLHPLNIRNCCVQVEPKILDETTLGKYSDNRKKGIEVCHKTCDGMDNDVFLLKLGKKEADKTKHNSIEIELKTPKVDMPLQKQRVTTETQITEAELDAALAVCKKKGKKKGKGKRKGKGKKK